MDTVEINEAAKAFSETIDYNYIVKNIKSQKGNLLKDVEEKLEKSILRLEPRDTLAFRLYKHGVEIRIIHGFVSFEYVSTYPKVIWYFDPNWSRTFWSSALR